MLQRSSRCVFSLFITVGSVSATFSQSIPAQQSAKRIYVFAGTLATLSKPYHSSTGSNSPALIGLSSGVQAGMGIINTFSAKWQLNTSLSVNNISPFFHYQLPVENFSYFSAFGTSRSKYPAPVNAAAITVRTTANRIFKAKHTWVTLGTGLAFNYVFTKRATGEHITLLSLSTLSTGEIKENIYRQTINRFSFDVPVCISIENIKNAERWCFGIQYNFALRPRSTGLYEFDMDTGTATGNYRFIGSTLNMGISYYITK